MASIPLTLAALATSAVPGLKVTGVRARYDDPDFTSAEIETDRGDAVVRIPRNSGAEVRLSAELLGLAALSEGSRAILPFEIPRSLGMTRAHDTRAVVTTKLAGEPLGYEEIKDSGQLVGEIAGVLAAIHSIPASTVQQGGLPVRDARETRASALRLLKRAEETRLLPQTVLNRWQQTIGTEEHWDFATTVVHGSLEAHRLTVADGRIVGLDDWSEFSVGDPAADFAWLIDVDPEVFDAVVARYSLQRSTGSLGALRARARFTHESILAKQLLHGVELHDQELINDAVTRLDELVDSLAGFAGIQSQRPSTLSEEQIEDLLDGTPEVVDRLSDTAAYEALDEDRHFGVDTGFVERVTADAVAEGTAAEDATAQNVSAPDTSAEDAAADSGHSGEQPTEPIAEEDLPR